MTKAGRPHRSGRQRSRVLLAVTVCLGLVLIAVVGIIRPWEPGAPGDPLAGHSLYVQPASPAALLTARFLAKGKVSDAHAMAHLADQQVGFWLTDQSETALREAHDLLLAAARRHQLPLLVVYDVPDRDCGSYSREGTSADRSYIRWVGQLATAIGDEPAIVVIEPDAVAQATSGCLPAALIPRRERDLAAAITTLRGDTHAAVYLDAGNSGWIANTNRLESVLRASGASAANGFSLNVSNFETVSSSVAYGNRISSALDGLHFVIDTGRDGRGPYKAAGAPQTWCNPPGRRLGTPPTTATGHRGVDAFLWIKQPGYSDGTCRGGPPAGVWWPAYALRLAGGG
jgi:endoglucanase